jgi:CshA-type fibril repeat protein
LLAPIAAAALLATAFAAAPRSVVASPPTPGPFTCAPGFYQVISGQLNLLNPVTATYTQIGGPQPFYNAMGYNVLNNYLYAMSTAAGNSGDLLRIASDGSITDLGLPTGLPAGSYVAGDFDNDGNLIIRSSATTWYSIDVATNVATTLTITGAADAGNDVVWINHVMYELNGTTLYATNLNTDVATMANVSGIASGSFGAAWSDNPNELFFSDNTTGHIYEITGFTGASPAGTLKLTGTVTGNNDGAACKNADSPFNLPVANDDTYAVTSDISLNENAAGGVLSNDVGTGLSAILGTGPTHGTLTLNADGSFTYTPTAGFFGMDTFTYAVQDQFGRASASDATVTLNVSLPAAPVAVDDAYTTTANTAINQVAAGGLRTNDTGTGITVTGHTSPAHGTVTVGADGSFLYTPASGNSGPDSFGHTDTDAYGRTSSATVSLTVNPVAMNMAGSGPGPGAVHATPPAPTGTGPFTYTLATTPPAGDGTASMDPTTGAITFTPHPGFHGTVTTFTYTVTDAFGDVSARADIDLTVGLPAPPVAHNVSGTTPADAAITLTPAVPSGTGPFTFALGATPSASNGVASIDPSTGAVTFTPAHGFSGIVPSFTYTATDADDQVSDPADVSIDVTPLDSPASGKGPAGHPITVQPPAPVGTGPFTYALVHGSLPLAADGTVSIDPTTGAITFTPAPGFTGTATVEYTVTDSDGLRSAAAVVTFDVSGASATVPSTGAMDGSIRTGVLLVVMGLLLIVGFVVRRTRRIAPILTLRR